MTERERLVELIADSKQLNAWSVEDKCGRIEDLADHLLANGVIVPPCKVGDTVYVVSRYYTVKWAIHECEVESITSYMTHTFISHSEKTKRNICFAEEVSQIGKTVFLSREEAEKALAERSGK